MRKRNWTVVAAAALAMLAIGVPLASSAQTVSVKSKITIGSVGYRGKVTAANPNCVGGRTVVLKQKGNGILSRVETKSNGSWSAELEELNQKIKIPAKVFAEVKPSSQATAGQPIYMCGAAVSKTVEIAGG